MPLKVTRRKDTGTLFIVGTLRFPDGEIERVRRRAASNDLRLAREEAAALEARLLRDAWHGERRGSKSFAEAVISYFNAAPRAVGTKRRVNRILHALGGDLPLRAINQETVDQLRDDVLRVGASQSTVRRTIVTPLRAVLRHAHRRGWCDPPAFEIPKEPAGRTRYFLPHEAQRLIAAAAPHIKPLLLFLLGTGARVSEALELDWRDVDLAGARAILWRTKGGKRRNAALPPAVIAALSMLPHREGAVFLWDTHRPIKRRDGAPKRTRAYADRGRQGGGQIKTAWRGALRRAGLDPSFTPHDLRHSWASYHYALHRDLLRLKVDGGWSTVSLVERYAHLMPQGQEDAIRAAWGIGGAAVVGTWPA